MSATLPVVAVYEDAAQEADIEFLSEEVPEALRESLQGIDQVASIVRALKSFAHPGSEEKADADLNELITTTVAVARNEWKCIADMDLNGLDPDLPRAPVLAGPLKQVLLNLIVNAAHALEETQDAGTKGTISVGTAVEDGRATITIADTGPGIPEAIQDRILEPIFTTKEVGKGSGQGLAIARSIVDKHDGALSFESRVERALRSR